MQQRLVIHNAAGGLHDQAHILGGTDCDAEGSWRLERAIGRVETNVQLVFKLDSKVTEDRVKRGYQALAGEPEVEIRPAKDTGQVTLAGIISKDVHFTQVRIQRGEVQLVGGCNKRLHALGELGEVQAAEVVIECDVVRLLKSTSDSLDAFLPLFQDRVERRLLGQIALL